MNNASLAVSTVAALTTAGVLVRPFKLPEAVWAVAGAFLVVALGLLPVVDAGHAIGQGNDVYLFLMGMMLLSETARRAGLFDWVAGYAVNRAGGSQKRLFLLVYVIGSVATTFLSNDATAVVLTPAVFAAARKAKADAMPYLLICAFIANAASFVLPISNPANLVLYGDHIPSLGRWMASFALPSALSILATYATLRFSQREHIESPCELAPRPDTLSPVGWVALCGLLATGAALTIVSALDKPLGLPTCLLGMATAASVLLRDRTNPWVLVKDISWSVLPLVAGLFVLVEALNKVGVVEVLASTLHTGAQANGPATAGVAGLLLGLGSNVVNNLPAGLIASATIAKASAPQVVTDALLIGVDLGPNLSITGSLATILWLTALRREGEDVGFLRFLKVGALVMPPALLLAIGARLLMN